ncbi:motility protein A [Egicoccus halophilus]|uniref:Flagellar motor protein MotP n=1 Tax=Egicoccus halophilus TaxID=1670830 RepID=A0A8J3A8N0_9ACTN|nr:MotA/TolQ/ExbB proton channel family protein [Egicoccus halophilus]GGI06711.1 flagellar motor protein MotP [Egicoccus halophilus]
MDPLFLGGLVLALLGIIIATIIDGNSFAPLIGPSSAVLVLLGALGAGLMAFRKADIGSLPKSTVKAIKGDSLDVQTTITQLAQLAEVARRDGMLALEARLETIEDRFVRTGVQLLVDGVDEEVLRDTLEIEVAATDDRHGIAIAFFKSLAGYAPTFGMVGTVIGLINMLGNLSDPSQLGKGMALALLTTLYGVMFANLLFNPVAERLGRMNELELAAMDVALDGILTIRRGASPRGVIERLESYLPPSERIGVADRLGKPGEAA